MDEQAGPGVFFNNNNNSVLPGAGKGPLPDGDVGEAARAQYSIPGILHFLQHEWARFEVERAQWDVERAELQAEDKPHSTQECCTASLLGPSKSHSSIWAALKLYCTCQLLKLL
nr:striatin-like [Nerophis lumbriciformis]